MSADNTINHVPDQPENTDPSPLLKSPQLGSVHTPDWCPDGYEIYGRLGAGGNGEVFKARHVGLERIVALKRLLNAAANREERDRFLAEARAVARLDHPNIIRIHDFGVHGAVEWYSLEFCPKGSLADRLRDGPLPLEEACKTLITISHAVGHAHAAGIIHRDIKPGNVLIGSGNVLKLADFGLAKSTDARTSQDNTIAGTPAYMAPEQINAPERIGPATDVWALGVMFYECLTGRVPFTGVTVLQVMQRIQQAEPIPPRTINEAIPTDLNTICLHALKKDPEKRYRTPADLAADLAAWLEGRPISVRAVTRLERGIKWTRRNPSLAGSFMGLVCAIIAGTGLSLTFGLMALNEARQLKTEQSISKKALNEARRQARLTRIAAAQGAWDRFQWTRFLGLITPVDDTTELIFEEKLWRSRAHEGRTVLPVSSRLGVSAIDHRNNKWPILASNYEGKALILAENGSFKTLEHEGIAKVLETDTSNRAWILTDTGAILVFDASGQRLLQSPAGPWLGMAVTANGTHVARWNDKVVEILDDSLKAIATITGNTPLARWAAASNSPLLAIAWSTDKRLDLWQPGRALVSIDGASTPFAPSPDGLSVVAASGNKIHRWNAINGERDTVFEPRLGPCKHLEFSRDGNLLASAGGTELRLLDGVKGRGLQFWMTPGTNIEGLNLSADGKQGLTWGDGIAQYWDLNSGSNRLMRGVRGPAHAMWESNAVIHLGDSQNQWESQSATVSSSPVRYQLSGWTIDGLARRNGQWIVKGLRGEISTSGTILADGSISVTTWPDRSNQQSDGYRLNGQKLEIFNEGIWQTLVQRTQPIRAWGLDAKNGIVGLALEDGRVERVDAATGSPIWDEQGPHHPVDMAVAPDGFGVATADGSVWVWDATTPSVTR